MIEKVERRNKLSLQFFCLCIGLFLSTLENYGNISTVGTFLIVVSAGSFLLDKKFKITSLFSLILAIGIVLLLALLSLKNIGTYKNNISDYAWPLFVLSTILKLVAATMILFLVKNNKQILMRALGFLLSIHLTVFIVQFLISHGMGVYIDVLQPFTGEAQRYHTSFSLPIIGKVFRCTGLFNEPSLYSAFILCIVFLRYIYSKKISLLDWLCLGSIFLSFATAGILSAGLFICSIAIGHVKSMLSRLGILFMSLSLLFGTLYLSIDRINNARFSPVLLRVNLIKQTFEQTRQELIFGNGPLGVPEKMAKFTRGENMVNSELAAFPDAGAWLFMIMKFGILSLVLYLFFIFRKLDSMSEKLAFLAVFFTKMNFLYSFYIIFSFLILFKKSQPGYLAR